MTLEDYNRQLFSNFPRSHIFYTLKIYTELHGAHFDSNKMWNKI